MLNVERDADGRSLKQKVPHPSALVPIVIHAAASASEPVLEFVCGFKKRRCKHEALYSGSVCADAALLYRNFTKFNSISQEGNKNFSFIPKEAESIKHRCLNRLVVIHSQELVE